MTSSCDRHNYSEIFRHRGKSYHEAMQCFPTVRDAEFRALLMPLLKAYYEQSNWSLLDVPSGGGYLASYLPTGVKYTAFDPSPGFVEQGQGVSNADLDHLPYSDDSFDALVSLAGLHHSPEKRAFVDSSLRILKPGGLLCVVDVAEDSPESRFLDEFVGKYNNTGHEGFYLNDAFEGLFSPADWECLEVSQQDCSWYFSSQKNLFLFCKHLFSLKLVSEDWLILAIRRYLGYSSESAMAEKGFVMPWHLRRVVYRKRRMP